MEIYFIWKARGQILSKDGDIVVGQEYTDFDKGLDDGIEGDIFGFNMVLSSTTAPQKALYGKEPAALFSNRRVSIAVPEKIKGHYIVASGPVYLRRRVSKSLSVNEVSVPSGDNSSTNITSTDEPLPLVPRTKRQTYGNYPISYVRVMPSIPREKLILKQYNPTAFHPYYYNINNNHYISNYRSSQPIIRPPQISETMLPPLPTVKNKNSRIANDIPLYAPKTLGMQLIENSFNCELGRGAPVKGREVLISWTKTPVRVFGGAILKKVEPFCFESLNSIEQWQALSSYNLVGASKRTKFN